MTYPNAVFSAFAFIGFVLCAIPLPWHIQSWNTGTCLFMIWTGLGCLNQFINSVIWTGNAINWAPVWCDISSKFIVGLWIGVPAASLCINRRLYRIACIRVVTATKEDKLRSIMVDLAIGLGLPVLVMILHYIIQGHRFNIFEDIGCSPAIYYTWPIYPIIYLPPIITGLFSATYSILTIMAFLKNRTQFNAFRSSNSNVSSNRFIRLMCLASTEVLFNIPLSIYGITIDDGTPLNPYISWENVHLDFSRVEEIPALIWRSNKQYYIYYELSRWVLVFCAFVFFIFFGFADEARKNYRSAFQSVAKHVGLTTWSSFGNDFNSSDYLGTNGMKSKSGKIRPVIPLFVHKEMLQRHNSMDSFSNMSIGDVSGALNEVSDTEKKLDFYPDLSYGTLSIADDGDTLSSPSSSTNVSSITYPTPARTRQNSGIEISSVLHDSSSIEPTISLPTLESQPTDNAV